MYLFKVLRTPINDIMKNKSLLITNIVLTLLVIIFFSEIESTFLHITHQWTISKAFPYFLLIISGTYFALFSLKTLSKNKLITFFVSFLSFSSPFILGFALNPIYQGDFSKDGKKLTSNIYSEHHIKNGLYVVTIPNCPYCYEAIGKLKEIKKLHPELNIEMVVCTSDSSLLETYKIESNNTFKITNAIEPKKLAKLADLKFPAFIYIKNNIATYKWDNSQFGVRAIDLITD